MAAFAAFSTLLMVASPRAWAQPLAPASVQDAPFSLEISGLLSADRIYLRTPHCDGSACTAIRRESVQGGEATLWVIPQLGFYAGGAHDVEGTDAALYAGGGYRLHGGVKGGVEVAHGVGVNGWASIAYTHTKDTSSSDTASGSASEGPPPETRRNQLELGAVARFGEVDGGLDAWIGVEAMPLTSDFTRVVGGQDKIELKPFFPLSAVVGARLISEPLGSPWAARGRLSAGITGELGYRVGVTGWLTASL